MASWAIFGWNNELFRIAKDDATKDSMLSQYADSKAQELTSSQFDSARREKIRITFDGTPMTITDRAATPEYEFTAQQIINDLNANMSLIDNALADYTDETLSALKVKLNELISDMETNGLDNITGIQSCASFWDWYFNQAGYPQTSFQEIL